MRRILLSRTSVIVELPPGPRPAKPTPITLHFSPDESTVVVPSGCVIPVSLLISDLKLCEA